MSATSRTFSMLTFFANCSSIYKWIAGISASLCALSIGENKMIPIDASTYTIPEEYLPLMLIMGIIFGGIFAYLTRAWVHEKAADNKVANGKIKSVKDLKYDKRYEVGTVLGGILAITASIFAAPVFVQAFFVNANMGVFAGVTAVLAAIFAVVFILILHWGIRQTIVNAAKYAVNVTETVKDAMTDVEETKKNVEAIKKKARELGLKDEEKLKTLVGAVSSENDPTFKQKVDILAKR